MIPKILPDMRDILNRITKVAPDTSKHMVGAVYCNWLSIIAYGFFNITVAKIVMGVSLLGFIAWEVYYKIKDRTPISGKDIMVAVLVVLPVIALLLIQMFTWKY